MEKRKALINTADLWNHVNLGVNIFESYQPQKWRWEIEICHKHPLIESKNSRLESEPHLFADTTTKQNKPKLPPNNFSNFVIIY